ncbi:hypothetical protein QC764_301290 [Podospora pseudoanserina]|uniref:Uncharacterized protein n=1 Tax=Podospora pseudoanserina TaxID=2609844 RepID=A0ABR0IBK3_9PEZI|nr:hypothetical protein QC764_301290 [Podospora pseudoanserina]
MPPTRSRTSSKGASLESSSLSSDSKEGSGVLLAEEQQPNPTGDGTSQQADAQENTLVPEQQAEVQGEATVPEQQPAVQDEVVAPQEAPFTHFRQLSQSQQDQANAEHAIEVILSYFIIDWDASKHWTSRNRVYSWHEPFHKDGRHPTATFTCTSKGDITEFAVLDALDVERDSPVRKMIQNRDKTHSVELTYHILVKAFTRTWNSYLDFPQEDKDVIRKFSRKVTNEGKQTISDWFIIVVCGAPFRAFEVEPDPWSDDSFVSWFEG